MRRRIVAALLLAAAALPACSSDPGVLATYGHSYVSGVPGNTAWPIEAAELAHRRLDNQGVAGSGSGDVLAAMQAHPPPGGAVVVIEAEINDVRGAGLDGVDGYRSNLEAMVALVQDDHVVIVLSDPPVLKFTDPSIGADEGSPEALAAFAQVASDVSAAAGATYVDLADGWDVNTMLGPDGLHPNDAGNHFIAQKVADAVAAAT